jgi:CubicO group peptidase (beta-lactamase class C family)
MDAVDHADASAPASTFRFGTVISTARDLRQILEALVQRALLKPATYDLMWTAILLPTQSFEWGLGWQVNVSEDYQIDRKDRSIPGYSAQLSAYEGDEVSVALVSNTDQMSLVELAAPIVAAVKGLPDAPSPPFPVSDCP